MSRRRSVLSEAGKLLVTHVTGFQVRAPSDNALPGQEYYDTCARYVGHHLFDVNGLGGVQNKAIDHQTIDKHIYGLAEKFSMKGQDQKGDALREYLERLRKLARSIGSDERSRTMATSSNADQEEAAQNIVSSVILLLLELSSTPTASKKGEYGYVMPDMLKSIATPKTQNEINKEIWELILKDDPLVGDHWGQTEAGLDNLEADDSGSDYEDMDINSREVPSSTPEDIGSTPNKHLGLDFRNDSQIWMHRHISKSETLPPPKALEKKQYWRNDHLISKQTAHTSPHQVLDYDIQITSGLSLALQESRDYSTSQSFLIMDEIDIIYEVFFLLQGLPSIIFVLGKDGSYKMSPQVTTSHLSPGAVSTVLQPFQDSATVIRTLQTMVDRICSASSQVHGKVIQMFASAVQLELNKFKEFAATIQQSYQYKSIGSARSMVSLIELQTKLSGRLNLMNLLLEFVKSCDFYREPSNNSERACSRSVDLLSRLFNTVSEHELYGDIEASKVFQRLLRQAIKPFLLSMEHWLSGQPLDSESDFMIKISPQVDLFSSNFWTDGYQIQTDIALVSNTNSAKSNTSTIQVSPCFVSQSSLQQLLYAGKAMQISLALKSHEASIPTAAGFAAMVSESIFEKYEEMDKVRTIADNASSRTLDHDFPKYANIIEKQYPLKPTRSLIHETTGTNYNQSDNIYVNFIWRMESELANAIQDQYLQANSLLKELIFTQSYLQWHFTGMTEFFFMIQGEIMHLFAASVFSKIKRGRPWLDSYTLESTFHEVATLCDWKYAKFVKVRVGDGKRPWADLKRLKAQTLELIEFDYMLPWPLDGILYPNEDSKRMYSRIAGLLFQLQTVKFTLEQSFFLKSKLSPTPELSNFWKIRMKFLSTMNDLWSYFMMTVLDVQIQKFRLDIGEQIDLDDIMRLSHRFISVCYERCFLKERTLPLYRSLLTMINLGFEFSALFSRFIIDRIQEDNMKSTNDGIAREKVGHGGRRVSFNTTLTVSRYARKYAPIRSIEDIGSDSEEDSMDQGQELDKQDEKNLKGDHEVYTDEDVEMDPDEHANSAKKQRMDSNLTDSLQSRSFHRREQRRTDASRKMSHGGNGSYRESLETIEQELNRCREFLAKSLQVVVRSNAARGFAARRSGNHLAEQGGEGDSDYLDGLILALSS
ncbi:hypothetical protein FBU30_008592 [Linnemannia zychae]|nr:hypothetical protein FBU30_008592 [Linnemannia zychae]